MIRTDQAVSVLRMLGAAWPAYKGTPDTAALYLDAMTRPPFVDLGVLNATAALLVDTSDTFPTIHQLVETGQAEARRAMERRRYAEEQRALARGTLPGMPALGTDHAVEMLDVLRTSLTEALDTRGGVDMSARTDELVRERGLTPPPEPVLTYTCAPCLDRGFVVVEDDGAATLTVRPCHGCNPDGFDRWNTGHLRPGHTCPDCDDLRRGIRRRTA